MRLIEKKSDSTGVTVDNDALMNFYTLGGQNGSLFGFELSNQSGALKATAGRLSIQGYTFEITNSSETIYDLTTISSDTSEVKILCLVVSFDSSTRDTAYRFEVKKQSEEGGLSKAQIQNGVNGDYYYPLCQFVKNGSSITDFASRVTGIVLGGGSSGSNGISNVPTPLLGIINSKRTKSGVKSVQRGWVVLANYSDYIQLSRTYKIKLIFMRYMQNFKYRSGDLLWTRKTEYLESTAINDVLYTDLVEPDITSGPTFKKTIYPVSTIIDRFFYDTQGHGHVTIGTTPTERVRATRSKKRKTTNTHTGGFKRNYVEFGFKIVLYNSNGQKVGESSPSNSIRIAVDKSQDYCNFLITCRN